MPVFSIASSQLRPQAFVQELSLFLRVGIHVSLKEVFDAFVDERGIHRDARLVARQFFGELRDTEKILQWKSDEIQQISSRYLNIFSTILLEQL